MSLELGKSGSYIRSITNGISMPSLRELFNIMEYFDLTPTLFFAPMDDPDSLRGIIGKKLLALPDEDLEKVVVFQALSTKMEFIVCYQPFQLQSEVGKNEPKRNQ